MPIVTWETVVPAIFKLAFVPGSVDGYVFTDSIPAEIISLLAKLNGHSLPVLLAAKIAALPEIVLVAAGLDDNVSRWRKIDFLRVIRIIKKSTVPIFTDGVENMLPVLEVIPPEDEISETRLELGEVFIVVGMPRGLLDAWTVRAIDDGTLVMNVMKLVLAELMSSVTAKLSLIIRLQPGTR